MISEPFPQRLKDKAVKEILTTNLVLLTYKRYVVDSRTRFKILYQSHSFPSILNKQSETKQYTTEKENQLQKVNFLDVTIVNIVAGKYEFKIQFQHTLLQYLKKKKDFFSHLLTRKNSTICWDATLLALILHLPFFKFFAFFKFNMPSQKRCRD